jgi:hypothetical protein
LADAVPGLAELWALTRGDLEVRIALLDGPVDRSHPSLRGANLDQHETLVSSKADQGSASRHGTAVASLIFGQHTGPLAGVAPCCRGLLLPIFTTVDAQSSGTCSQLDLTRAILQAIQQRVHLINISGGQFSPSGAAHALLADAVRQCGREGILIVAAAGNHGCDCLQVPAALDSVLAVGAMGTAGEPLPSSNWGGLYRQHGILAPGENLPVAEPGGGVVRQSGTSFATAVVTGLAALLLSLQRERGEPPNPRAVRDALLRSAIGCAVQPAADCRRLLAGRLNVRGAFSILTRGPTMSEPMTDSSSEGQPNAAGALPSSVAPPTSPPAPDAVAPSAGPAGTCGCAGAGPPSYVYALGQIGYDLVSEARHDSFIQSIPALAVAPAVARLQGIAPAPMLAHLGTTPHHAASLEWTLNMHGYPVYAIRPVGPFAAEVYAELRRFLDDHVAQRVERVSIPGRIAGRTTLLRGQVVPVIVPELRGMFSWTTAALTQAVVGAPPGPRATAAARRAHTQRQAAVRNFLDRVYHEVHNLGVLPQERALNYAATNALTVAQVFAAALGDDMELDSINVVPSRVCRPGSDCWDVELYFFYPQRPVQTVRRLYRFTVDVSDVVPVTVGEVRTWSTR